MKLQRHILGRIPPHTHFQVCPSLCETPHMDEWTPNDAHNALRLRMSTMVSKQFDWHYTHFTSSQGWAVTQINKPCMFWSSTHDIIYFNHYQTSYGLGTMAHAIHKTIGPPGRYFYCQVSNISSILGQFTSEQGLKWINFFSLPINKEHRWPG